jgi:hypothetical protein
VKTISFTGDKSMTDDIVFRAEIIPVGEFRVGNAAMDGNTFNLSIVYLGDTEVGLADCTFYLRTEVGEGQPAMVLNREAAERIEAEFGIHDIEISPYPEGKQFVWKIVSYDETPIKPNEPIVITFSNIISETEPGKLALTFQAQLRDNGVKTQITGELIKQPAPAGIIYFYSTTEQRRNNATTPESIAPAAEQILPGEKLILKWYVQNLDSLTLTENGRPLPDIDFKTDKGEEIREDIRQNTDFVLSGKADDESKPRTSKVRVEVLQTGWHDSTKTFQNNRLEPTLLFNADNQIVYGVFRDKSVGNSQARRLFQSENPFWGWAHIHSQIPESFATSAGTYCDNKLWFIGGSQIDPDQTSNQVCCFDPQKNSWTDLDAAPWVRRMGHTCLRIPADKEKDRKEQIWIMGGCDQNGNILDDVWSFDVSTKTWRSADIKLPGNRCMFSCVVFNKQVWLCGGLDDDPLSDKLLPDIFVWNDTEWKKKLTGLAFIEGEPMTACLQVFQGKLHIIGKTRIHGGIEAFHYFLKVPTTESWEKQGSDALQGWGLDITLSYQLINFQDKLLIAKAMGYEEANPILKLYVPMSPNKR